MSDDYDAAVAASMRPDAAQSARVGFAVAADTNPDAYAEAQRVARRTGVPIDTVFAQPEEMKKQSAIGSIDFDSLARTNPATAVLLANVEKAKVAHDDVGGLTGIESLLYNVGKFEVGTGLAIASAVPKFNEGVWGVARAGAEMFVPDVLGRKPLADYFARMGGLSRTTGDRMMPKSNGNLEAGWYSGMQSLGLNAILLPAALASGGSMAPMLAGMGVSTGGAAYGEARDKGKTVPVSLAFGLSQGVIEAGTEMIGMPALFSLLKPGSFLKKSAEYMVKDQGGEQIATHLQDLNEWAVLNPEKTIGDYLKARPDAAIQTALATAFGGGGQVLLMKGAGILAQRNDIKVETAGQTAELLAQLNEMATASKVLQRDATTFEQHVQAVADNGPAPEAVFISAQTLQQSGFAEQVSALSPAVAEQFQTALDTGGDVRIPVGEYAANIAGTTIAPELADHLKFDPEGFTQAEAQTYMQERAPELQAEVDRVLGEQSADESWKASAQEVEDAVFTELQNSGRFTESVNRTDAVLHKAFASVMAAKLGTTPMEFFKAHTLRVIAERVDGSQQFDQEITAATVSDSPAKWASLNAEWQEAKDSAERIGAVGDFTLMRDTRKAWNADEDGRILAIDEAGKVVGDVFYGRRGDGRLEAAVEVAPEARRKGIASAMYDAIESATGEKLAPAEQHSEYAAALWRKRTRDAFDPNDASILKQGVLGEFAPSTNTISLLKNADLSTFLHESGHFFLEVQTDLANSLAQDAAIHGIDTLKPGERQVLDDHNALLAWFGVGARLQDESNFYLSAEDQQHGADLRDMAERFNLSPRALVDSWKAKSPRKNTEQGLLWEKLNGIPELALYAAEHPNWRPGENRRVEQSALDVWNLMSFEEKRAYHEQFARGFEAYLFEGKAPSIELHGVFQRFRAWLLNVYKSLDALKVELTDEVRGVFDRMLATTEQIQLAEQGRSMMPLFERADQAGMTPEDFAAYQALGVDATNTAIEELQARGLRDMQWLHNARGRLVKQLQKESDARRAEVRMDARREIMSMPIYQAWAFLTGKQTADDTIAPEQRAKSSPDSIDESLDSLFVAIGKLGGLNKAEVVSTWGTDPADKPQSGVFGKPLWRQDGGLSIDGMAEALAQYGYLSPDENGKVDLAIFERMFGDELRGQEQYSSAYDPSQNAEPAAGRDLANPPALTAGRLDRGAVDVMGLPPEVAARLDALRMVKRDAMHPDLVAGMFGFSSGDELLRTLATADKPNDAIDGLTDQRMLEQYGDLSSQREIEKAADAAIHNDVRARMVATEANAMAKATGKPKILAAAAKEFASAMIARLKVRAVKPGQYANAEVRASKAAAKASKAGDLETAGAEKRNQLINNYATRAAYDAQSEVEKALRYLKKFDNAIKGLDPEYTAQIDALLERFDLRKKSNVRVDKMTALAAWVESQRDQGLEPDIPPDLLNEAFRKSYKDMTVEEFRGMVDTVKQIEHLGRLKHKLLTAKNQRAYEAVRDEIVASIEENAQGREADTRTPTTTLGRVAQGLKRFWASHIKAAIWARVMDGGKDGGPMWEYFIRVANERGDYETTERARATEALSKIMAPVFAQAGRMGGNGQFFPSIHRSLNREARIALALNVGNEGNLQRLLGGEGWTVAQILPVLQTLTPQEKAAVQAVWDHFETYRPEIAAKQKRVYGKEPDWITPGSTVSDAMGLRGGYYPIKYDPAASQRAEEHADAEDAKRQLQGAYTTATTRRSFTKARAEEVSGRPLLYTLSGLYSGVNDVIHDLAWHEWLIDTNRLLRSQSIDAAIRNAYGPEVKAQFKTWAADIAEGDKGAADAGEAAIARLRQGVSVAGLGFNVMSAAIQPLGLTQSIVRVGAGYIGRGVTKYLSNPIAAAREANEKSSFMENRARTRFRELNELRNQVQDGSATKELVGRYAYFLMMRCQQVVDVPTWHGAYEKAIGEGNDEERAISLSDQAVIDAQGSGQTKDLSAIERGGPALRLFTVFYSFMNTALNLGVVQGMAADTPAKKAKLASDYLLLYVIPPILGYLLKNALTPGDSGDDDPEKLARKLAANQIDYLMGLMFVAREFSGAAKTAAGIEDYSRGYSGPAGVRVISDAYTLSMQVKQGEFDDAFRKALINTIGGVAGLPSAQINRTITGTKALIEGETSNPAAIAFGFQKPR